MKFIVCVTLAPDTEQLNEVQVENVGAEDMGVTMVLNPWDEFAVEEALQLEERFDGETVALTLGHENALEALKRAVAMGVGEAYLISDPAFDGSDAWGTASVLAEAIKQQGEVSLILTGKQSVDGNSGLVGPGLACKLGLPFVSQVAQVVDLNETHVTVVRALDEGRQTVRVPVPAVIAVSKEINEPRYPNFMGIRKASRLQYPTLTAADLPGLDLSQVGAASATLAWQDLQKPPKRATQCEFIEGATASEQAAALVEKLIAAKVF